MNNARAILRDYRKLGDVLWSRFNANREDILWYYRSLVEVYRDRAAPLNEELTSVVAELEAEVQRPRHGEIAMDELARELQKLDKEYPLVPHTRAGQLFSSVRRMKAEKDLGIPIERRTGFAISTRTGKRANQMTEQEWETFYSELCAELKQEFPDEYSRIFAQ